MHKRDREPGVFVGHYPCPCGKSSDGLAVYRHEDDKYDGTCFACPDGERKWFALDEDFQPEERMNQYAPQYAGLPQAEDLISIQQYGHATLADRGIRSDTLQTYGVRVSVDPTSGAPVAHYYPVYKRGQLSGYKKRYLPKIFSSVGDCKIPDFFGQVLFPNGGHRGSVVLTEGELDAMAAYQMTYDTSKAVPRRGWRCASLPSGASGLDAVKRNLEWLESFEKVILALDNDIEGKKATDAIAELLSPGKAHRVTWPQDVKDACDMLRHNRVDEFMSALFAAAPHTPAGIVSGQDTWGLLHDRPRVASVPYPPNWELQDKTYGLRLGELDTWTSGSGSGKTQMMRELQFHLIGATESNIGIIALEEPIHDTIEGLMSLYLNKRIHLPDVKYTPEEYHTAWRYVAGSNRIHLYDHWGSTDADTLYNKIRYMARGLDCRYVFLDHLSIVVSEFSADGDERRQIDTIMSKLKSLTQELNIWIGLVVHLRKTSAGKSFEEGAVPTTDDLRGSGSIKQLSNGVFAIARNQQHPDEYMRNTSSVHVLKCRFTGRTGQAGWLHFDHASGRMIAVGDPMEEYANRQAAEQAAALADGQQRGIG